MEKIDNEYQEFKNQCNFETLDEKDKNRLEKVYKKSLELLHSKFIKKNGEKTK